MSFEESFSNKNKKKFYVQYSLYFLVLCVFIFCWYFFSGRNFIYNGDGINQHYPAYIYYGKWLRKIVKNFFVYHTFSVPSWDFNIGYGSDVIKALCYYVVGDPFCLPLVLIPSKYVNYYFNFSVLLRLYCAGLSFILFCREFSVLNKKPIEAIFSGLFTYIFYYFAIYNVARHPFFLNPLIFFPLIITGLERIIKHKSPLLFVVSVALSAASNFYFFYAIVILTIVYGIVREIVINKTFRIIICDAGIILLWAILGVCMSAGIVLPSLLAFLEDSRAAGVEFQWLYSIKDYLKLPLSLYGLYSPKWTTLAFSIPSVLALVLCLVNKKHSKTLKIFIVICFTILIFPFLGQILNGFSYVSNRWNWAFALLTAFVLCYEWDEIVNLKRRDFFKIGCGIVFLGFYTIIIIKVGFSKTMAFGSLVQLFILLIFCYIICFKQKSIAHKHKLLFLTNCLSIVLTSTLLFSPMAKNYAASGLTNEELEYIFKNEIFEIKKNKKSMDDKSFSRCAPNKRTNISLIAEIPSTQYYWSLSNPNITEFNKHMEFSLDKDFCYVNLDFRTALNALSCVKYFYKQGENVPYGFIRSENENIYINLNHLPFAFCYDDFIGIKEWKELDSISKQEVFLQKCVLDKNTEKENNMEFFNEKLNYSIIETEGIKVEDNSFIVEKNNAWLNLEVDEISDRELYILFKNLHMTDKNIPSTFEIQFEVNGSIRKVLDISTSANSWYTGQSDFTTCLGFIPDSEKINEIKVIFSNKGIYTFESISIISENVKELIPLINNLKSEEMKNVQIKEDFVSGEICLQKDKILMLNIPYEKGWKAYVDGKEQNIIKGNVMYSALELSKGKHLVILKYRTPGMISGNIISVISIIFTVIFFVRKYNT